MTDSSRVAASRFLSIAVVVSLNACGPEHRRLAAAPAPEPHAENPPAPTAAPADVVSNTDASAPPEWPPVTAVAPPLNGEPKITAEDIRFYRSLIGKSIGAAAKKLGVTFRGFGEFDADHHVVAAIGDDDAQLRRYRFYLPPGSRAISAELQYIERLPLVTLAIEIDDCSIVWGDYESGTFARVCAETRPGARPPGVPVDARWLGLPLSVALEQLGVTELTPGLNPRRWGGKDRMGVVIQVLVRGEGDAPQKLQLVQMARYIPGCDIVVGDTKIRSFDSLCDLSTL